MRYKHSLLNSNNLRFWPSILSHQELSIKIFYFSFWKAIFKSNFLAVTQVFEKSHTRNLFVTVKVFLFICSHLHVTIRIWPVTIDQISAKSQSVNQIFLRLFCIALSWKQLLFFLFVLLFFPFLSPWCLYRE